MLKNVDIKKILKIVLMITAVLFMLTACGDDSANEGTTKTPEQLSEEQRECWQKDVLNLLYDTMGSVAMGMYAKTTEGAMSFMVVAFAIWFVFRLMKFLSSIEAENSGQVWNEVFKQFLICLICGLLASSTTGVLYVLNMFIFPIFNAFLEFGGAILNVANVETTNANFTFFGEPYAPESPVMCVPAGQTGASLEGFPESSRNMMSCMICALSDRLSIGFMLSFQVMATPGIMPVIIGFLILCCFTFIKLGFVFYLVDTIFKFTMMVVLLPLLIMAYAFKMTQKWTKEGIKIMFTAAAFMMALSIMVTMTLLAVITVLQNKEIFGDGDDAVFREFGPPIFCLLMIAFLIVSSVSVAAQLSSSIAGSKPDMKFQKKLGGIAKMVVGWLTGGVGTALMKIKKVKEIKDKVDKVKAGAGKFTAKINKFAGRGSSKDDIDGDGSNE